ncbi:hypothetical protein LCGC14_0698760 [marine sediment metagenome]|uniref:Uncharacterized protein n=1 Tax=marine sediment metagenome TaxID=412755 RepID=A0A0F9R3S8_9ZZZZ
MTNPVLKITTDMRAGRLVPYQQVKNYSLRWRIRRVTTPPRSFPRIAQTVHRNIDNYFFGITL